MEQRSDRGANLLDRLRARMLLSECTGRDIWPLELCREKGIPEAWIEQFSDCFESGFNSELDTIYFEDNPTNQFHGVQDLDLAHKLGEYLGVDTFAVTAMQFGRLAEVRAIQEAADES
ncbi:MAG: hypothetical protein P8N76_19330 [Pirellulaceae bacterium]|nr:hypothetical protein [Pirellulaceae bacterium]